MVDDFRCEWERFLDYVWEIQRMERTATHSDFVSFANGLKKKMDKGALEHGPYSLRRPVGELLDELKNEIYDLAGWSAIAFKRLSDVKASSRSHIVNYHANFIAHHLAQLASMAASAHDGLRSLVRHVGVIDDEITAEREPEPGEAFVNGIAI